MADAIHRAPIAIIAFNRPEYFAQVVESLLAQKPALIDPARVHLFQDGAINPFSREKKAEPGDLAAVRTEFLKHFPEANLHASDVNLGVALNIRRAERFVFETLAADMGFFVEDDLVLSPNYVEMLRRLVNLAEQNGKVAYVAAFGDPQRTFEDRPGPLIPLYSHWAFVLFRQAWEQIDQFLAPYYALLEGIDYAYRDNTRIFDLYQSFGLANSGTSQDSLKALACTRLGLARVNTKAAHATYIGEKGVHMTPGVFGKLGYRQQAPSATVSEISQAVFDGETNEIIDFQLRRMQDLHARIPQLRQRFVSRPKSVKDRVVDEELVRWAYRIMLLREVESEQRVAGLVARRITLENLVKEIARSREFRERILQSPD